MKYIKDLDKLYGLIKALDQIGVIENISYFEKSYNRLKKSLKVLEIIKEKKVDVGQLEHDIKKLNGLSSYNFLWQGTPERQITEIEFNLLKKELL